MTLEKYELEQRTKTSDEELGLMMLEVLKVLIENGRPMLESELIHAVKARLAKGARV